MYNDIIDSMNENSINFDNNSQFSNYNLDNFNIYEKDNTEHLNKVNNVPSYYLINKPELEKNNIEQVAKSNEPKLYTSNEILNIFNKESNKYIFRENLKKLEFSEYIEDDLQLTKKKRIRSDFDYDNLFLQSNNNSKNNEKGKKRGREAKDNNNKRETHDKRSPDNIIKKVKAAIFKYTLSFLNNILEENLEKNAKLLPLDYKYVNNLQKEKDLNFLNMNLKDLFSKEISPKYKNKYSKDYNKKKIERILKNGNDIILFAFKITLSDWLDIFTLKKSVKDIINKYNNNHTDKENLIERIEQNLICVDKILNKIVDNNDEDYLAHFIFSLYNYERWFHLKKSRDKKKK